VTKIKVRGVLLIALLTPVFPLDLGQKQIRIYIINAALIFFSLGPVFGKNILFSQISRANSLFLQEMLSFYFRTS
jgi:hypothetical protein